ncbi:MAG: diaminopimelate epimerase [Actinobacteria bacterium]|nr:MAG: diaminopimelate epimerase [Actinomycetota bacterium]
MHFYKYQATGNDFIIIDSRIEPVKLDADMVKQLCNRHFSIGSDGLIICANSNTADAQMIFYNPDGSQAEMCGNGIRCLAAYIMDKGVIASKAKQSSEIATSPTAFCNDVSIETAAGIKTIKLNQGLYSVNMGAPQLDSEIHDYKLEVEGNTYTGIAVSMGNPHFVIFMESLKGLELTKIGPIIEKASLFKNKTNVEFVKVIANDEIDVVVWERGAGATLSCGTGACASLVASVEHGLTQKKAKVNLPGGQLVIEYIDDGSVLLTGPAEIVFEGDI